MVVASYLFYKCIDDVLPGWAYPFSTEIITYICMYVDLDGFTNDPAGMVGQLR
jgi:hypothetical protein